MNTFTNSYTVKLREAISEMCGLDGDEKKELINKDFSSIVKTCLHLFDLINPSRIDIEFDNQLIDILQGMGCPKDLFQKHMFNPCGAPNTWPLVIGMIDWLLTYVKFFASNPNSVSQSPLEVIEEVKEEREARYSFMSDSQNGSVLVEGEIRPAQLRKSAINDAYTLMNNAPVISSKQALVKNLVLCAKKENYIHTNL